MSSTDINQEVVDRLISSLKTLNGGAKKRKTGSKAKDAPKRKTASKSKKAPKRKSGSKYGCKKMARKQSGGKRTSKTNHAKAAENREMTERERLQNEQRKQQKATKKTKRGNK